MLYWNDVILHATKRKCIFYDRYILIYPQGCDVCNHLSLFLCVANHDKLLPGMINDFLSNQWCFFSFYCIIWTVLWILILLKQGGVTLHSLPLLWWIKIQRNPSTLVSCSLFMYCWAINNSFADYDFWLHPISLCRYTASILEEGAWLGMEKVYGVVKSVGWIYWCRHSHNQSSSASYQVLHCFLMFWLTCFCCFQSCQFTQVKSVVYFYMWFSMTTILISFFWHMLLRFSCLIFLSLYINFHGHCIF